MQSTWLIPARKIHIASSWLCCFLKAILENKICYAERELCYVAWDDARDDDDVCIRIKIKWLNFNSSCCICVCVYSVIQMMFISQCFFGRFCNDVHSYKNKLVTYYSYCLLYDMQDTFISIFQVQGGKKEN